MTDEEIKVFVKQVVMEMNTKHKKCLTMSEKTTVEVSKHCADIINKLNNADEEREFAIETIANTFASLSDLLQHGRDSEDIAAHADDIIRSMDCVSQYYKLIKELSYDLFQNDNCMFILKDERNKV